MKLRTFIVGTVVSSQVLIGALLLVSNKVSVVPEWFEVVAAFICCFVSAGIAHHLARQRLVAPIQELVVLAQQVASHPDVPRLRPQIKEIALLEDSLRRLAADLAAAPRASGLIGLSPEVAHELRSSLGAVKNALYYIREVCRENHLAEKDPALLEIISHAELEIEKAVAIAAPKDKRKNEASKGGQGASV